MDFSEIEKRIKFIDCKICGNKRVLKEIKDGEDCEIDCKICAEVYKKRSLLHSSYMSWYEYNISIKHYNNTNNSDSLDKNKAHNIYNRYIKSIDNTIDKNINMYIHSRTNKLSYIYGLAILNRFIRLYKKVRIYDGSILLDCMFDSFNNRYKYYYHNKHEDSHYIHGDIYFNDIEDEHDLIFIHGYDFTINKNANSILYKLLSHRYKNKLLTIISSINDYHNVLAQGNIKNFIGVGIGELNFENEQINLINELNK